MADVPLGVDDVDGGPVVVPERVPDRVVTVDRDGVVNAESPERGANVLDVLFELELGAVHPEHDEPLILVPGGPRAHVGLRALPVDAGVGPEVRHPSS